MPSGTYQRSAHIVIIIWIVDKFACGTADLLATSYPATETGSYKLHPSNFYWSPVLLIRVVSSFGISMLSAIPALVYSMQLQKLQCEPRWRNRALELIKNTQTEHLSGVLAYPWRSMWKNQTGHSTPLLSAGSGLSIHSTPVTTAAGAFPQGVLFFYYHSTQLSSWLLDPQKQIGNSLWYRSWKHSQGVHRDTRSTVS